MEILRLVVVASFLRYFKALQPINLILINTGYYKKLFPVCENEILQVTVNEIEVLSSFRLISGDFWLKMPRIVEMGIPC